MAQVAQPFQNFFIFLAIEKVIKTTSHLCHLIREEATGLWLLTDLLLGEATGLWLLMDLLLEEATGLWLLTDHFWALTELKPLTPDSINPSTKVRDPRTTARALRPTPSNKVQI